MTAAHRAESAKASARPDPDIKRLTVAEDRTRTMVARVIFFFSVYASARPWAIAHARRAMCSAETATAKRSDAGW
jgi:hypothetical protein